VHGFTPYRKSLAVSIDANDLVTEVIYSTSGKQQ
jgi:hypothetical protein